MRPETKLLTMDCRPKPMPTDSAPATIVSLSRLSPRNDTEMALASTTPV
jgi:hypothetical protein